jgi:hypothetical protein
MTLIFKKMNLFTFLIALVHLLDFYWLISKERMQKYQRTCQIP